MLRWWYSFFILMGYNRILFLLSLIFGLYSDQGMHRKCLLRIAKNINFVGWMCSVTIFRKFMLLFKCSFDTQMSNWEQLDDTVIFFQVLINIKILLCSSIMQHALHLHIKPLSCENDH